MQDAFYMLPNKGCVLNATLNGVCDEHRLCPEGSACTDSVCKCAHGFYTWNDKCLPRLFTDAQVISSILQLPYSTKRIFALAHPDNCFI